MVLATVISRDAQDWLRQAVAGVCLLCALGCSQKPAQPTLATWDEPALPDTPAGRQVAA